MRIDIATLFPDMCDAFLDESIIGRARKSGKIEIYTHNIRDYTLNKHRKVDDSPYGGGMGMVLMADPVYRLYQDICEKIGARPYVIYMSPEGKTLTQDIARQHLEYQNILIICGHYEGLDERLIEEIVDEELSVGDYVVTGGELPALIFSDAVCRMVPGVLSDDECFTEESHYSGLLEYAQYTKPDEWHGKRVPEVLLSGHHANIKKWRLKNALSRTRKKRPDMYRKYLRNK